MTGGKKILGRKRHLLVDTTGLILRVHVHPADEQDRDSGLDLLVGADQAFPRIEQLWADGAYQGEFEDWVETTLGWRVTIVSAAPDQVGFAVQPRRWVVERTFAHLGRYRRMAKDFEQLVECVVAHILTASIHIMLKRLVAAVCVWGR
jgi:putative transposase